MSDSSKTVQAEKELRQLITNWSKAVESLDAARIVADYTPDVVSYDAIPPYKSVGPEKIKAAWECCLPYFPQSFKSEHRDLEFHIDGDLAVVHGLHHFVPEQPDHPCGQTWMRVTVCYRRVNGQWKVFHEHISLPFNPMNNQAWHISSPDNLDVPDYSDAACQ
jgi:uncharacterized protein (TIGR02246 family)